MLLEWITFQSLMMVAGGQLFARGWAPASNLLLSGSKGLQRYITFSDSVSAGAETAMKECRQRFQWDRWNCPEGSLALFNEPLPTREMSFVHAISSAGVMYSLTRNCSLGQFENCGCDESKRGGKAGGKDWQWGGCSDNIKFGERISKVFVDGMERGEDALALMNLHNNDIGRKAVRQTLTRRCKCHGVSGSCSIQTCWDQLGPFGIIGEALRKRYETAVMVDYVSGSLSHSDEETQDAQADIEDDLVFLQPSPNYCHVNTTVGTTGTLGRECLRGRGAEVSPWEARSCKRLCTSCGLGVKRSKVVVSSSCNCKFHWCCEVQCETCTREVTKLTCARKSETRARL
ncbi:protein Wnt-8-like [Acanthaster planci]|uniref:Protein Wnt n=1 Tax=Acanthaster planci TaxID=133434 RepID=A0A8B7YHY2_ACAPL|nr:protein Wnt-8-like [Acanthaster planci]